MQLRTRLRVEEFEMRANPSGFGDVIDPAVDVQGHIACLGNPEDQGIYVGDAGAGRAEIPPVDPEGYPEDLPVIPPVDPDPYVPPYSPPDGKRSAEIPPVDPEGYPEDLPVREPVDSDPYVPPYSPPDDGL